MSEPELRPRRRIWCELLPPEELGSEATIALLGRFRLEPLIALPPDRETRAMAEALRRCAARGIRVGLWPLLRDADGYWPSESNAEIFAARIEEAIGFTDRAGVRLSTLAIDLEPPLEVTRRLMKRDPIELGSMLGRGLGDVATRERRALRRRAFESYRRIVAALDGLGIETLAAVAPHMVLDFASHTPLWQRILKTPIEGIGYRVISPMLYTSLFRQLIPLADANRARSILFTLARLLRAHAGDALPSVSLGLVSTGKLGDESRFRDPAELLLDVEATLAAGVGDLALFSLEGVLERGAPEAWLVPFTTARPRAPSGVSNEAMSAIVRALVWALRSIRKLAPSRFEGSCVPPRAS
jgi:hypothetical protein